MAALRGDMSFRYLKQFFLVKIETGFSIKIMNMGILEKCISNNIFLVVVRPLVFPCIVYSVKVLSCPA
jgi:hypothetical protein